MDASRLKVRIPGKIAEEIGIKIVSGRLRPDTVLDGEIEASGERNVSRSAYREAVRILVAKGLVQSRPKLGTRITPRNHWHLLDPDVLRWIFAKEPSRELLESLFELRKIVEPEAAALAAERHTPQQLNRMKSALTVMERETLHTDRGQLADQDFHDVLLEASANPFLISLSSSVIAVVAWSTMFKERTRRLLRDSLPDHAKVYKAIAARNPKAARLSMMELIDLALADATQRKAVRASAGRNPRSNANP